MKTRKKPSRIIQLIAAVSLNGMIADTLGNFESSPEDRDWLQKKIQESDAVVVGRKTFQKHIEIKPGFEKPLIIFTRIMSGSRVLPHISHEVHFFHDSKEEFENLCDLMQYRVVTVLGGAEIYHWFIEQNLATDFFLTLEPFILGSGMNLLKGSLLSLEKSWILKSVKPLNTKGSQVLHYQP